MIDLSIVIPAYNEGKTILESVSTINEHLKTMGITYEIIVVDDGSTDDTCARSKYLCDCARVITLPKNRGKGAAVRAGVYAALGNRIFMCDADLSMSIIYIDRFLSTDADIVIGSRALKESAVDMGCTGRVLSFISRLIIRVFILPGIKDSQCGFKMFTKECKPLFELMTLNRWGFDFELLYLAKLHGFSVKEIPVLWIRKPRSRIRKIDYLKTLWELVMVKLNIMVGFYDASDAVRLLK
jgi:dolichyl-phosphate beta-glucosyltransferase